MDLAYRVLDDQIVDVTGRRCGRVDDIELEGEVGGELELSGLLTGRGTYGQLVSPRLRRLVERLLGRDVRGSTVHRIPWSEVEDVTTRVSLYGTAEDFDLALRDRAMAGFFAKLPGGS